MKKNDIRKILRESIVEAAPEAQSHSKDTGSFEKDYAEVQKKLNDTMLKASQVMSASGLGKPDDATARSLFSKKLRKAKNDEGGLYQFSPEELASIMKVVNNPASYLNVKSK